MRAIPLVAVLLSSAISSIACAGTVGTDQVGVTVDPAVIQGCPEIASMALAPSVPVRCQSGMTVQVTQSPTGLRISQVSAPAPTSGMSFAEATGARQFGTPASYRTPVPDGTLPAGWDGPNCHLYEVASWKRDPYRQSRYVGCNRNGQFVYADQAGQPQFSDREIAALEQIRIAGFASQQRGDAIETEACWRGLKGKPTDEQVVRHRDGTFECSAERHKGPGFGTVLTAALLAPALYDGYYDYPSYPASRWGGQVFDLSRPGDQRSCGGCRRH